MLAWGSVWPHAAAEFNLSPVEVFFEFAPFLLCGIPVLVVRAGAITDPRDLAEAARPVPLRWRLRSPRILPQDRQRDRLDREQRLARAISCASRSPRHREAHQPVARSGVLRSSADRCDAGQVAEAGLRVSADDRPPGLCGVSSNDQVVCPSWRARLAHVSQQATMVRRSGGGVVHHVYDRHDGCQRA